VDEVVARLLASREFGSREKAAEWLAALDELPTVLTQSQVESLLPVFDDETSYPDEMFDLIHRIEKSDLGVEEEAILRQLPGFAARSPWWCETLLIRLLNHAPSRDHLISAAPRFPDSRQAFEALLARIADGGDVVGQIARDVATKIEWA
jgi:hypothetical protein